MSDDALLYYRIYYNIIFDDLKRKLLSSLRTDPHQQH